MRHCEPGPLAALAHFDATFSSGSPIYSFQENEKIDRRHQRSLRMRFAIAFVLLGNVFASAWSAEVVDAKENHAFIVPDGWEDQKGRFGLYVYAESGGNLSESKLPFQAQSVDEASARLVKTFANANTTFRQIGQSVAVSGKTWNGRIATFEGTVNTILQMVANDGRKYRVFYLTVPNEKFRASKDQYLDVLRTWRSPYRQ
jgi:hypothetical protein